MTVEDNVVLHQYLINCRKSPPDSWAESRRYT